VCGNEVITADDVSKYQDEDTDEDAPSDWPNYNTWRKYPASDYACVTCRHMLDSDEVYGDEPAGYRLTDSDYDASDCLDSDVIITSSPFYTFGPFCSPCVPGAVNLDSATGDDYETPVRAYCFGHEWFEGNRAPYRVFRVSDNTEVFPNAK
jgi:hypothetical protein